MEHVPVLLEESMAYLKIAPEGRFVDCTCGLGGHTRAIAERLTTGQVLALDRDAESLEIARQRSTGFADRILFRHARFSQLAAALEWAGWDRVDGVIADLGVSRFQLTAPERGLSLMNDGPLDMRLDRSADMTAADIVNGWKAEELVRLFVDFGEERRNTAERVSRALIEARPVTTTRELADLVARVAPRTGKIHPATKIFQALRVAVNEETSELDALLGQAPRCIDSGGRWVMISFHSLDDRKVKNAFRDLGKAGAATVITRHVVRPSQQEVRSNPASRSGLLRVLELGRTEKASRKDKRYYKEQMS